MYNDALKKVHKSLGSYIRGGVMFTIFHTADVSLENFNLYRAITKTLQSAYHLVAQKLHSENFAVISEI